MLSRDDKVKIIVDHEVDSMDMDGLIMYAEDHLHKHFEGKGDDYIEELFLEVMDGQLG